MTSAPSTLLAVRRLLLTHLDNQPGPDDLDPGEVGIVGDPNHRGGYHCGSDRVDADDYSVDESPRDRAGLTLDAAALDVGQFAVRVGLALHDLPSFSVWLVAQCKAGAPDTRDIREVIYSPDGVVVRRWDRLGRRSTGDSSHRGHTHISYHRDAIKAGRDQTAVFRRYLTYIGILEDDMTPEQDLRLKRVETMLSRLDGREPIGQAYLRLAVGKDDAEGAEPVAHPTLTSLGKQVAEIAARPAAEVDYDQLADAIVRRAIGAGQA